MDSVTREENDRHDSNNAPAYMDSRANNNNDKRRIVK